MCRWPNGDLSFVSARNKEDAIIMLDEWDNAETAEVRQIQNFMVDFRITDNGELEFQAFGERSGRDMGPSLSGSLPNQSEGTQEQRG
jgi:hypothetical protein